MSSSDGGIFMSGQPSKENRERYNDKRRKEAKRKKNGLGRTRNFATVLYPDSAPIDWLDKLTELKVPAFISPLHDKDVNPDGEAKKAHWHVMFVFESVKTDEQVQRLIDEIGGVGLERVNSMRGYARYLCHLDNPEKHQYAIEDVRSLCGADYINAIGLATDKYTAIAVMMEFCEEFEITSFSKLALYAKQNRMDWFRTLCDNGAVFTDKHLKSKQWTENQERPTHGPE
jgi:hypothetical protein